MRWTVALSWEKRTRVVGYRNGWCHNHTPHSYFIVGKPPDSILPTVRTSRHSQQDTAHAADDTTSVIVGAWSTLQDSKKTKTCITRVIRLAWIWHLPSVTRSGMAPKRKRKESKKYVATSWESVLEPKGYKSGDKRQMIVMVNDLNYCMVNSEGPGITSHWWPVCPSFPPPLELHWRVPSPAPISNAVLSYSWSRVNCLWDEIMTWRTELGEHIHSSSRLDQKQLIASRFAHLGLRQLHT